MRERGKKHKKVRKTESEKEGEPKRKRRGMMKSKAARTDAEKYVERFGHHSEETDESDARGCLGREGGGVTYSQPEPHIAGVFTSAASSMTPSPQHSSSLLLFRRQDAI